MNKKSSNKDEINFWQPTSDLMTGLVLILLLVILLLVLYLIQVPDSAIVKQWLASNVGETETKTETETEEGTGVDEEGIYEDDGSGADEEEDGHHEDYEYVPTGGGGGGAGGDGDGNYHDGGDLYEETAKSAVHVYLIDGDTLHEIAVPDVAFRLYSDDNKTMALYTYYPEKLEYTRFLTTQDGSFYLPEKISDGKYTLEQLTKVSGYDLAENTSFELTEEHDWGEAYRVDVLLYPCRNTIKVLLTDAQTGEAVAGGHVAVYAAENIVSADGTLRCQEGDLIEEIVCGEDGQGESSELYLGKYRLVMDGEETVYADTEPIEAELTEKTQEDDALTQTLLCQKTTAVLKLVDELNGNPIKDAVFMFSGENGSRQEELTTDENGEIQVENLKRSTTYQFQQISAPENYFYSEEASTFSVSSDGRIDQEAIYETTIENRLLRVSLQVVNWVLNTSVNGVELSLFDEEENLIDSWTQSGSAKIMTDLPAGHYTLRADAFMSPSLNLEVKDTASVQEYTLKLFTWESLFAVLCLAVAIIAAIVLFLFVIRRLLKRKKSKKSKKSKKK